MYKSNIMRIIDILKEVILNMKNFQTFLDKIDDIDKEEMVKRILIHIKENFPQLKEEIKWNQPMFTDHGTFIIGISIAKGHISISPESEAITYFENEINKAGYSYTKGLFRIKWTEKIDFDLIDKITSYNIESKKDMKKFWRS